MFQTIGKVLVCMLCGLLVLGGCKGQTEVAEISKYEMLPETSPLGDPPKGVVVINESSKYLRNIEVSHRRGTIEEALAGNERVRVEIDLLKPGEQILVPSAMVMGSFRLRFSFQYTDGPEVDPLDTSIPGHVISARLSGFCNYGATPMVRIQEGLRWKFGTQCVHAHRSWACWGDPEKSKTEEPVKD